MNGSAIFLFAAIGAAAATGHTPSAVHGLAHAAGITGNNAKVFKAKKWRVFETPVSYAGRTYAEGKKIGAWDGVMAVWTLLKFRFVN